MEFLRFHEVNSARAVNGEWKDNLKKIDFDGLVEGMRMRAMAKWRKGDAVARKVGMGGAGENERKSGLSHLGGRDGKGS